jgi:hypothetical protein
MEKKVCWAQIANRLIFPQCCSKQLSHKYFGSRARDEHKKHMQICNQNARCCSSCCRRRRRRRRRQILTKIKM